MAYSEKLVEKAARIAYKASMSGGNDNYVETKTALFVQRCHKYDNGEPGSDISHAAIEDTAFAALDPYCSLQLWAFIERENEDI